MNTFTRTFDTVTDGFQALLSAFGRFWLAVVIGAMRVCSLALQVFALVATVAVAGTVLYLVYTYVLRDLVAALLPALPF